MLVNLIVWLFIGAVAGWVAGQMMKGRDFGLTGNIIVGILGSIIGGWLSGWLGISFGGGLISSIITAVFGAVVLLAVLGLVRR